MLAKNAGIPPDDDGDDQTGLGPKAAKN